MALDFPALLLPTKSNFEMGVRQVFEMVDRREEFGVLKKVAWAYPCFPPPFVRQQKYAVGFM